VIEQCADVANDLRGAQPADVAGAYRKLGLRLTYHPGRNLVQATASPKPANIGKWLVSEGGLEPPCPQYFPESGKSCG
jgi:site-specific DNA recombinase